MQGHVSSRKRWAAGVAAGTAATLAVGALALVPAAGTNAAAGWAETPSPFASFDADDATTDS